MHMNFKSNQIIEGYYKNKLGLEFRIFIKTNNLIIKTRRIERRFKNENSIFRYEAV